MVTYNLNNYTFDQCIEILHAYTMQIRSSICPSVKDEYTKARSKVINYMRYKWPEMMAQ